MTVRIIQGDALEVLNTLPDTSVNMCCTSPPYWGLRDYGCSDQIGLEQTPDDYVFKLVAVFQEVRRILRNDGTLWLNLGDSYAGSGKGGNPISGKQASNKGSQTIGVLYGKTGESARRAAVTNVTRRSWEKGCKPKDLIGIPWRVAFALQSDGWWLRQDIIWSKPNPMPESVTDRCTKSHEYIFLLSKSAKYYYDQEAIKEPSIEMNWQSRLTRESDKSKPTAEVNGIRQRNDRFGGNKHNAETTKHSDGSIFTGSEYRNKRSVWTVATQPRKEAHFATFPPALITPCILAGCPVGGSVLDPFGGSGTTGEVSEQNGRNSILIELNPKYVELAKKRTQQQGLFCNTRREEDKPCE